MSLPELNTDLGLLAALQNCSRRNHIQLDRIERFLKGRLADRRHLICLCLYPLY
jgi:hypothetical protein